MLFVVFAIAVAYVVAVSILSKKTNAWNSFMGRLRYIKAIVVPDGQRRLHSIKTEGISIVCIQIYP